MGDGRLQHLPDVVGPGPQVLTEQRSEGDPATWSPGRRLDAYVELRATVRRISLRALFGEHLGARADHIGQVLEPA
ncbi:MAG: hypothetical protein AAFN30_13520, partial [Actinomycetota bacterium]